MNLTLAYFGASAVTTDARGGQAVNLKPNLARDPVAFDAPLQHPVRFREAISALHDVVVSDLRFKRRDRTAYEAWKKDQAARESELRRGAVRDARADALARTGTVVPPGLQARYERGRRRYWQARQEYATYLLKHDPALWRVLMPCDPVVTVADDALLFECFSADESTYGCLTVARDEGFGRGEFARCGTTNVDYSWDLYHHFQGLRTYRETRFGIDPTGFEVATAGGEQVREEKIDLPAGWLRGFLQLQAAMGLPMRRVPLAREAVYSLLAWLKRHRERKSPRALRFELLPDRPPALVLEPWDLRIVSEGTRYQGPPGEPIRVWGRRRLLALARVLPLAERFDVYLLGTGLPTFWVAQMGEMRLTLGLSGWTKNDWTRGSALDLLAPVEKPSDAEVARVGELLRGRRAATFAEVEAHLGAGAGPAAAALNHLAHAGQAIYDLGAGIYRLRQVMPLFLGEEQIGPDNPELVAARDLVRRGAAQVYTREAAPRGGVLLTGRGEGQKPAELLLDADGRIRRGVCPCSHHHRFGIRNGPCRHLLALRTVALGGRAAGAEPPGTWFDRLRQWAGR